MYDENLGNYFISRLLGTTGTKTICGKCGIIDNDILNYIPKKSHISPPCIPQNSLR